MWDGHLWYCATFGKELNEVMGWPGLITHRQFLTWQAWRRLEMDRPNRSDHYAMQTACEVRRVLAKNPRDVKHEHFLIKFQEGGPKAPDKGGMTREQALDAVKTAWIARIGRKAKGMLDDKPPGLTDKEISED